MGAKLDKLRVLRLGEMGTEAKSIYDDTARIVTDRLKHEDPSIMHLLVPGSHRRYIQWTISAKFEETIVGGLFYGFLPSKHGNPIDFDLFINYLGTLKEYEGRGIGRVLVSEAESVARELNIGRLRLNVSKPVSEETSLVSWYSQQGFEVMGTQMTHNSKKELVDLQKVI